MANNPNDFDMKGINFENVSTTKFGYREEDRSTVAATKGWLTGNNILLGVVGLALIASFFPRNNGLKVFNYQTNGNGTEIRNK